MELFDLYHSLDTRPDGLPPFEKDENGAVIIVHGERFCRLNVGQEETEVNLCFRKDPFSSTRSLRAHVRYHGIQTAEVKCKRPSTTAKDQAIQSICHLMSCVEEFEARNSSTQGREGEKEKSQEEVSEIAYVDSGDEDEDYEESRNEDEDYEESENDGGSFNRSRAIKGEVVNEDEDARVLYEIGPKPKRRKINTNSRVSLGAPTSVDAITTPEEQAAEKNSHIIEPANTFRGQYDGFCPIKLRIATGGAGESGLLRALADGFINYRVENTNCAPFTISWLKSDTTESLNYLARTVADVVITYHPLAETAAIKQDIADRREYAWRDHWMLVGPKSNEAKLEIDDQTTIYDLFSQLFRAAVETQTSKNRVRFLSRYDKSATNIKESSIWSAIGQTPWSHPYSKWYHRNVDFPFKTLEVAALLGEYTIIDRGTWLAVEDWIREKLTVYMEGGDDETDVMLNPAHALVCTRGGNKEIANEFVDWLIDADGGQAIVGAFAVNDVILYSMAPAAAQEANSEHKDNARIIDGRNATQWKAAYDSLHAKTQRIIQQANEALS